MYGDFKKKLYFNRVWELMVNLDIYLDTGVDYEVEMAEDSTKIVSKITKRKECYLRKPN